MPSTYTLNNGIELIGTGEQSGTWGDTTNTNFELIDTALDGQVSVTLASAGTSGAPNTLPISDGSASNGRNRLVIFNDGGDLGATAYVQLTPSDAEKIVYVRNDLSGSRSIILFQGTYNASNDYEVPAGTTAVVYFDGAGAGAVAANVFNNAYFDSLRLGGVSVTAILDEDNMASDSATALATQQSIKAYVDAQVTAQDLDFAGDTGTGAVDLDSQTFTIAGTANEIETSASGQTITVGLPNSVTIASLTATTADINGGTIDGTVIGGTTPAAVTATSLTATGTTTLAGASTTADITFGDNDKAIFGAGSDLQIYSDGTNSWIEEHGGGDLYIEATNLTLRALDNTVYATFSDAGASTIYHAGAQKFQTTSTGIDVTGTVTADGLTSSGNLTFDAVAINTISSNGFLYYNVPTGYTHTFQYNGTNVLNMNGPDISFYEDTGTTPKFFWDASAESLGLGSTSPDSGRKLHIEGGDTTVGITLKDTAGSQYGITNDNNVFTVRNDSLASDRLVIDSSGNVGIGTSSPSRKLHVSSSQQTISLLQTSSSVGQIDIQNATATASLAADGADMYFYVNSGERMRIDSSGRVGIGTSSPSEALTVSGAAAFSRFSINSNAIDTASTAQSFARFNNTGGDFYLGIEGGTGGAFFPGSTAYGAVLYNANATPLSFYTNATERMRIDSSGNVGIGTNDPAALGGGAKLTVNQAADGNIVFARGGSTRQVQLGTTSTTGYINADNASGGLAFHMNGSERMRIDSSGNLLVGTTSTTVYTSGSGGDAGVNLRADGQISNSSNSASVFNRMASDGPIHQFRKDGTTVGSIGSYSGSFLKIQSAGNKSGTLYGTSAYYPLKNDALSDGAIDLGEGSNRFKDLYLSGAVKGYGTSTFGIGLANGISVGGSSTTNAAIFGTSANQDVNMSANGTGNVKFLTGASASGLGSASERMRIDASGNLLVGKTVIDTFNEGFVAKAAGGANVTSNGTTVLDLNRRTSDGDIAVFRKDNTTVGSLAVEGADLVVGTGNAGIRFYDQFNTIIPRIAGGGGSDATVSLGYTAQRFKDLYLSGGVYLGGTGAANKLDDYEVGTFTPVIVGQTTGGTGIYTLQKGGYIKVGQLVHFQIQLGWSAHTGTGNFRINGLPFNSASVTPNAYGGAFVAYNNGLSYTSGSNVGVYVAGSSDVLAFTQDDAGTLSAISMDTACTELIIVGSYIAA